MQWLAQVCVRRPVFASVIMLLVAVVGFFAYGKLGLDEFPNVDFPVVIVTTRLDGAAPEEVETDITDKIEGAVSTIGGIDQLASISSEGVSQVVIGFTLDKNSEAAANDVRDHISSVLQTLPKGIDAPVVSRVDPDASPVLLVALKSPDSIRETTEVADKRVRRSIESINGVGQVTLVGGRKRQINLWLNPVQLRAFSLTPSDVQRAIASQNLTTPGGRVETGPTNLTLRVQGRVESPEEMGRIVVREQSGRAIRIADVARIEDGAEETESYAQLDDARTLVLGVRKQSGTNTVEVVDAVKERLATIEKGLPKGYTLEIFRDNSLVIRTGIDAVKEHLVVGAILAAIVVLIFLGNVRSTIIAALAIPISIVGTFMLMWIEGFTLNFLTLLALALAVGIVIDDAIVVLENIYRFIDEKKVKPFPAAVLATREIGLAVLATTLSLMAVFLPVAFMGGIVGRFLKSFGFTMAFAIGVSLVVSFSLTPMLAARWLKPKEKDDDGDGKTKKKPLLERVVDVFYRPVERAYMAMLRWSMAHRWVIVVACALALGSCVPIASTLPGGFLPPDDRGMFDVTVRTPEGMSVGETRLVTERLSNEIRRLPGVVHALITVADDPARTPNYAKVSVQLTDPKVRDIDALTLMNRVRKEIITKQPKEYRINVTEVQGISTGAAAQHIQYALSGPDLAELAVYAGSITEELRKVPGAVDVDNSLIVGKPELHVRIDRDKAATLGVNVADIAGTLQLFVGGLKASTYAEKGEEYDVRIRAEEKYRADVGDLSLVTVPSAKVGSVPLSSVVTVKKSSGPSTINRIARRRQVTILANSAPGIGDSNIDSRLREIVAKQHLPPEYTIEPVGQSKEFGKAGKNFLLAFSLSFIFMYLILAAQFESWLHPITILLSLPLTVPFALLSLKIFGQTMNIDSALGLLVLFGVVKKNSILQIDHTNHLRKEGLPRLEAILQANRDRLRPILMTTAAFVAGMIPLITSKGVGAGGNHATAGVILGGQTFSLLLTLLATPVAYSLFDDARNALGRRFGSKHPVDHGERELDRMLGAEQAAAAEAEARVAAE